MRYALLLFWCGLVTGLSSEIPATTVTSDDIVVMKYIYILRNTGDTYDYAGNHDGRTIRVLSQQLEFSPRDQGLFEAAVRQHYAILKSIVAESTSIWRHRERTVNIQQTRRLIELKELTKQTAKNFKVHLESQLTPESIRKLREYLRQ